jgi:hypothetical protein
MLSRLHRHELCFESILIFQDRTEVPCMDLARLSDMGGDIISSQATRKDSSRKVLQRAA